MAVDGGVVHSRKRLRRSSSARRAGRRAKRSEHCIILWSNEGDGHLVSLIVYHYDLVLREQDVRVVRAKDITADDDLDGRIVGGDVLNQESDGQGRKLWSRTAGAGGRLMKTGFRQIDRKFDEMRLFLLDDKLLQAELSNQWIPKGRCIGPRTCSRIQK